MPVYYLSALPFPVVILVMLGDGRCSPGVVEESRRKASLDSVSHVKPFLEEPSLEGYVPEGAELPGCLKDAMEIEERPPAAVLRMNRETFDEKSWDERCELTEKLTAVQ